MKLIKVILIIFLYALDAHAGQSEFNPSHPPILNQEKPWESNTSAIDPEVVAPLNHETPFATGSYVRDVQKSAEDSFVQIIEIFYDDSRYFGNIYFSSDPDTMVPLENLTIDKQCTFIRFECIHDNVFIQAKGYYVGKYLQLKFQTRKFQIGNSPISAAINPPDMPGVITTFVHQLDNGKQFPIGYLDWRFNYANMPSTCSGKSHTPKPEEVDSWEYRRLRAIKDSIVWPALFTVVCFVFSISIVVAVYRKYLGA